MNRKWTLIFLMVVYSLSSFPSSEKKPFCTVDETAEDRSVFYCKDPNSGDLHTEEVDPILVQEVIAKLAESGMEYVAPEVFITRVSPEEIIQYGTGALEPQRECESIYKAYYRTNEFNRLSSDHRIVKQLVKLADALHEAGVCSLPVKKQNFNSINIQSQEDLLHHFLCISNSESVFGTRNIGQGGRGPWGIHPMHNQRKGTRAFVDGRTVTLKRDGKCYPSQAVVRDGNGQEIKSSDRYLDYNIIVDNAKCAMTLYREKGFTDWGRTKAWGSNRHCSESTRDRLQFFKHIGAKGCCTAACRARFMD